MSECWFCKTPTHPDGLIAGYDTFEEQRLACILCHAEKAVVAERARITDELERERRLTARHHRLLRVTRRTCGVCWESDHAIVNGPKP